MSVEVMLEWAKKHKEVFAALPVEQAEIDNLHRGYVANVIYTIVGDDFTDWVDRKLKQRTKKITEDREMNIKMDPEIYKIFKASTSISGKSLYLIMSNIF